MALGRPSEYDPLKHPAGVSAYVALCKAENYLPTLEGLPVHLGVARQTLYDWRIEGGDRYQPEFSDWFVYASRDINFDDDYFEYQTYRASQSLLDVGRRDDASQGRACCSSCAYDRRRALHGSRARTRGCARVAD
jgi:hypothetical protein